VSERHLEALYPKCHREDITYMHLPHKLLIESINESKRVRYRLLRTLFFKLLVLAKAHDSFHLSGWKIEVDLDRQAITYPQEVDYLLLIHGRQHFGEILLVE